MPEEFTGLTPIHAETQTGEGGVAHEEAGYSVGVGQTRVEAATHQIPVTVEDQLDHDRAVTVEEEEEKILKRAEAAGAGRYKTIIENLKGLGDSLPGSEELIQQMENKHSELVEKARQEYEAEQAQARAEAERIAAEQAEQERQRQEKFNKLREETLARVVGVATGEIKAADGDPFIPILRFDIGANGLAKEDHLPILDELDISNEEEYNRQHEEAATEMRVEQTEELIDLVYAALGTKRPSRSMGMRDNSHEEYGRKIVRFDGSIQAEVEGMPDLVIQESWTRMATEGDLPAEYSVNDVPVAGKTLQIYVRESVAQAA